MIFKRDKINRIFICIDTLNVIHLVKCLERILKLRCCTAAHLKAVDYDATGMTQSYSKHLKNKGLSLWYIYET